MIVFDLQALQSESFGDRGIGRYVADLAAALAGGHAGAVDVFAWNDAVPRTPQLDALADTAAGVAARLRPFSELRGGTVDLLHVNAPFDLLDYADVAVPVRARRLVVTCYDLIPYLFPDVYLADPARRARYVTRLAILHAADAVVTDSESAARDVVALAGVPARRVTVIGGAAADRFVPPVEPLESRLRRLRAEVPGLAARFVLVPTGMDWRKNVAGAVRAFGRLPAAVRAGRQLVLACKADAGQRAWVAQTAAQAGVGGQVLVTGFVPDELLVLLYQSAELVLFPSYYEGFGLPVLEARRCGARVICAATSSLPEVLPAEAAWFDPWDVDDIAARMERALTDAAFAAELAAVPDPDLSWAATARATAGVYASLTPRRSDRAGRSRRPRLGVVTPLPPAATGVADHSARLVGALHDLDVVDVETFVDGVSRPLAGIAGSPLAALALRWEAGDLDAVLYCVGNNALHRSALAMLPLVPGHVLLHDVRLGYLFREAPARGLDVVARSAMSVLVQSAHAAELARSEAGIAAIDVGPHPCEVVATTAPIDDGTPPWVVSAGIAHESKRSGTVAAAMAQLVAAGTARAAIVGDGGGRFVTAGDGVVATGQVGDADLDRWLRRAAVAVQLRAASNGESSGVAAHALARGVPLVVTDVGAMSELPGDAVVRVPVDVGAGELAAVVAALLDDEPRRAAMRAAALDFAARETPAAQARRILAALQPAFMSR